MLKGDSAISDFFDKYIDELHESMIGKNSFKYYPEFNIIERLLISATNSQFESRKNKTKKVSIDFLFKNDADFEKNKKVIVDYLLKYYTGANSFPVCYRHKDFELLRTVLLKDGNCDMNNGNTYNDTDRCVLTYILNCKLRNIYNIWEKYYDHFIVELKSQNYINKQILSIIPLKKSFSFEDEINYNFKIIKDSKDLFTMILDDVYSFDYYSKFYSLFESYYNSIKDYKEEKVVKVEIDEKPKKIVKKTKDVADKSEKIAKPKKAVKKTEDVHGVDGVDSVDDKNKTKIILKKTTDELKPKKKSISLVVKRRVWAKHVGEDVGKTKCFCCKLTDITMLSFHCGHIIAESKGGTLEIDNLLPICQSCNSSMNNINLHDYVKKHGL